MPIYVRLTIDGLKDEISTGIWIDPDHWEQSLQVVTIRNEDFEKYNKMLSRMEVDQERHFDLIQAQEEIATPKMVFEAYRSPLQGERVMEEKVKNLQFSDDLDKLIADYCDYNNRFEKIHKDGKVPHPTRAEFLLLVKKDLDKHIDELARRANAMFDNKRWEKTLILSINEHLLYFLQMTSSKHRSPATLEKMWGRKRRCLEFMEHRFKIIDLPLSELTPKFLEDFKVYNMVQRKTIENTATRYNQAIKETINRSVSNGWLLSNILQSYKCSYIDPNHDWLTYRELIKLIETDFLNVNLQTVRDLFVFCSFTGLSYAEVRSFEPNDIITGIDGGKWVSKSRQKTGGDETLPLLPIAMDLIKKYNDHPVSLKRGRVFPVPSNVEYNRCLKAIACLTGIKIVLRTHKARFFFANEVTFNQGVPIKTISRMLGQKSERAVHTYVKANREAIRTSMQDVKAKLFTAMGDLKGLTLKQNGGAKIILMK